MKCYVIVAENYQTYYVSESFSKVFTNFEDAKNYLDADHDWKFDNDYCIMELEINP